MGIVDASFVARPESHSSLFTVHSTCLYFPEARHRNTWEPLACRQLRGAFPLGWAPHLKQRNSPHTRQVDLHTSGTSELGLASTAFRALSANSVCVRPNPGRFRPDLSRIRRKLGCIRSDSGYARPDLFGSDQIWASLDKVLVVFGQLGWLSIIQWVSTKLGLVSANLAPLSAGFDQHWLGHGQLLGLVSVSFRLASASSVLVSARVGPNSGWFRPKL